MGPQQRHQKVDAILSMQRSRKQHRQQGFSMLELVIVIIIISVLLAIAISKLMKLQVQAERSAMENVIGTLQSAIALTISEHIAKDRIGELRKYISTNPMDLLSTQPQNYKGSFAERPANLESASWWYNTKTHTLYYQVSNREYFSTTGTDKGVTKFKILAVYDDINSNGRFDRSDTLKGLRLSPLAQYHWLNEPVEPEAYANEAFPSQ
ncbi:MAG: prepilin-type N-terminal cleavage/methylation domain-containing protein [Thioalkalispiraceae bacterium]|jgi:prepilin-type N-terminal cleavage/methylation domain-containing protein